MSLIPYQSIEGREIVLRHRNAIVVRDPDSQRLEIRGYAECPTCHQPLRPSSSERPFDRPYEASPESSSYVNPSYFRMLQVGNGALASNSSPSSPGRRFKPALPNNGSPGDDNDNGNDNHNHNHNHTTTAGRGGDPSNISGTPERPHTESSSSRIKREAFTPNYFKTFFVEERILGKGGKGIVLLVRHEIDGCQLGHFACKRVPIGDDHGWLEKVLIEVELLAKLSHPNLVSYRHVWLEDTRLTIFGPPVPCAFILQQYCNSGDLHQYVIGSAPREFTKEELKERMRRRSRGKLEEPHDGVVGGKPRLSFEEIYSLFKDITSGVAYLHSANYVHRDLKPSNCLLHSEGGKLRCLISDFGEVQPEQVVRKSTGSTGTISYCAPEVLRMDDQGNYANFTTKSDVFSLGMILYFMCFGRLPYQGANAVQEELEDIDELRAEITDWKGFQDEKRERPDLPARLYMLLKKLLALDPAQRPSANEVLAAMKSETAVDGVPRDRSLSPTKGLRVGGSNRIQNLDSPAPSGTPASDSTRRHHHRRHASSGNGVTQESAWSMSVSVPPVTTHETGPEAAGSSSSSTDQSGGLLRPTRAMGTCKRDRSRDGYSSLEVQSVATRERRPSANERTPSSPHLLLAPPPSSRDAAGLDVASITSRTLTRLMFWMEREGLHFTYLGRLGLFLAKMAMLTRPCWPYMVRLKIGLPLVVLAALDLGSPPRASHYPGRSHESAIAAYILHPWPGKMALLLALHGFIVWAASHRQVLCTIPNPRSEWVGW